MSGARMAAFVLAWLSVGVLVVMAGHLWYLLREFPLYRRLANLLYPLSQLAIAVYAIWAGYTYGLDTYIVVIVAVCALGCAVYDLVLFRGLLTAECKDFAARRARLLEEQVAAQTAHLERLTADLDVAQRIRSDMVDRLDEVQEALRAGDADEARRRLAAAAEVVRPVKRSFCGHPVVDALLAAKVATCEGYGIETRIAADVPRGIGLPDVELCAVFANLIDNAINACQELSARSGRSPQPAMPYVAVDAGSMAGVFSLTVENSCDPKKAVRPKRATGLDEHGWGLSIVEALAKRHDGALSCKQEGGTFTASVTMLVPGA